MCTNMYGMFSGCISLISLDISNFDTSQVTDIFYMFNNCHSLNSINLLKFDVSNVLNMSNLFSHCYKLESLDLSQFDFSQVTDIENIFFGCSNLKYINIKNLVIKENVQYNSLINSYLINPIICIDNEESFIKFISYNKPNDLTCSSEYSDIINNKDKTSPIYI